MQVIIADFGIASRRAAESLIERGAVRVNGEIVTTLGTKADPDLDQIEVAGRLLNQRSIHRYFIFHKPLGVTTTLRDPHAKKTVADYFEDIPERLFPAGRLDQDSTGLLLMTNDGNLVHKLTHPSFGIEKHYRVTINRVVAPEDIRKLEQGIDLGGEQTAPCRVEINSQKKARTELSIVLHEGKKRQIRRMIDRIGGRVIGLHRYQYGPLALGDLKSGKRKELTLREVEQLKKAVAHG